MLSHDAGGRVSLGGVLFTLGCTDSALTRCIQHCCRYNLRHKLPVYRSTYLARPRMSSLPVGDAAWAAVACTAGADRVCEIGIFAIIHRFSSFFAEASIGQQKKENFPRRDTGLKT